MRPTAMEKENPTSSERMPRDAMPEHSSGCCGTCGCASAHGDTASAKALDGETISALRAAEAAAEENLEGWKRARADFQNLEKRLSDEVAGATQWGKDTVIQSLLPIADYFEAAVALVPDSLKPHPWMEGILRIHQAFQRVLRDQGVTPIADTGVPLDPAQHEAVAEEMSDGEPGTVASIVSPGYRRGERVLRPAKVKVAARYKEL